MNHRHQRYQVSCEIDGTIYNGNYWVAGMILVVSTAKGGASALLGDRTPNVVATSLLTNLANTGKA